MAVIENVSKYFYLKSRPSAYKSRDSAYMVGGNKGGAVLSAYPRPYPMTAQQRKIASVAKECGIRKGISKSELQKQMVDCVGPKLRK